jgi:hypothetical protein
MPRRRQQSKASKPPKLGAEERLQRLRTEINRRQALLHPESAPKATFRDSAIGRPVLGKLVELTDDVQSVLDREKANFHPEGPGILYIRSASMLRFASRSLLTREIIDKHINRLDGPAKVPLQINRGEIWLAESPSRGNAIQNYDILAPIIRAYKHGEPTKTPLLEQEKLAELYGFSRSSKSPSLWLGYINLPKGSGAAEDIASSLDEVFPDRFTVGPVRFFSRQEK